MTFENFFLNVAPIHDLFKVPLLKPTVYLALSSFLQPEATRRPKPAHHNPTCRALLTRLSIRKGLQGRKRDIKALSERGIISWVSVSVIKDAVPAQPCNLVCVVVDQSYRNRL